MIHTDGLDGAQRQSHRMEAHGIKFTGLSQIMAVRTTTKKIFRMNLKPANIRLCFDYITVINVTQTDTHRI